jgi:hypothetical protein
MSAGPKGPTANIGIANGMRSWFTTNLMTAPSAKKQMSIGAEGLNTALFSL